MKIIYSFVFLIVISACQPAINIEQEAATLMETDRAFARMAIDKGTAVAFRDYFEPAGFQFPDGLAPIRGREAVYQSLVGLPEDYILLWEPELAEVSASGDLGWTWGFYTATYRDSTRNAHKSYGKYLTVWRKQSDGSWLVRADIGNKNPDPETEE